MGAYAMHLAGYLSKPETNDYLYAGYIGVCVVAIVWVLFHEGDE